MSHIDMDYLITYMATMDTEPDPMARPTTIHMAHNSRDDLASHTDTVFPTFYILHRHLQRRSTLLHSWHLETLGTPKAIKDLRASPTKGVRNRDSTAQGLRILEPTIE